MADEVRLIDGNALKEDFMNDYSNYMMESLRGNYHDTIRISEVIERIEDAPTIEASPCDFCQYNGCGNPCIVCPATAKEDKDG